MINKLLTKKIYLAGRGFTLIETLLAVLLLTTAIAGPLTIASKGLLSATSAKDQVTAFFLAQDAIEYLRFKRDSNCLGAGSAAGSCPAGVWLQNIVGSGACSADGTTLCQLDSVNDTVTSCSGTCSILNYNSSLGYFGYSSGSGWVQTPQRFIRTVKVITPWGGNSAAANFEVTVSWMTSGVAHSITVRENILNWQ